MKKLFAVLLVFMMLLSFSACSKPAADPGDSAVGPSELDPSTDDTGGGGTVDNDRPYAEWVGVWESEEGTMVIRFSHMADFVLDCYYYYPDQGFGFQINISDDEVDGNYIHSKMIDPAYDYHAEYEFTLYGDTFDFVYHYAFDAQLEIIEESVFTKTDETDIEGTWKYYWNL